MIAFQFDGTKSGLLSCLFYCYYEKKIPNVISSSPLQYGIGEEIIHVETDEQKAERVDNCLSGCKTKTYYDLPLALKSGEQIKFTVIFNYLKKVIDFKDVDISKNFADGDVLAFTDLIRRLLLEAHRFKGFLRFFEADGGYYYATYEPDGDITELLMPHFKDRFRFPFVIHDIKRNILGLSDGRKYKVIKWNDKVEVYLSEGEKQFESLWKTYYRSVNIKERKNERLMRECMPKRYWKHTPEKHEDTENF